jgi:hypothetical protein
MGGGVADEVELPEQKRGRPWKSRATRVVIRCAVAILSLYVLYVAAINVFLSTSLFERVINQDPESLFVTYERGWSIWPGRIQARHLTIRSSDSHVQWILRIERCNFDVSFFDLAAHKKFHVTRVEGWGVTYDGRQRIASPEATPEYVAALPPIPGFDPVPLLKNELPNLLEKWDDHYYHLWTVELERVTAHDVREVWIDTVRFEGSAMVTGGFFLRPIRKAYVSPSHVDVSRGRVTAKERPLGDPVTGAVDFALAAFDPRILERGDLLHHITMRTDLRGHVPDLANVPRTLTGPLQLSGPAEVHRLAVRVDAGNVVSDSHVDATLPGAAVEVARHRMAGDLTLRADVADDAGSPQLTYRIEARAFTATRIVPEDRALLFHAPLVDVSGDARALDLTDPLRDLHVIAALPAGEMPDVRSLARYMPAESSFGFMGGKGRVHARIEAWLDDGRAKGDAGLEADDLDLGVAKTRITGGTSLDASFDAWRWEANRLEGLHAKVHVAQGSIATQSAPANQLVDVKGFEIGIDAPHVDLDDPMRSFHARVDMPDAQIVDRGLLKNYLPRGNDTKVSRAHAEFDAHCAIGVEEHLAAGTFDLHSHHLGLTLEDLDLFTDLTAHARVHDWSWEHGDLALDEAKVDFTNVSSTKHGADRPAATIEHLVVEAKTDRFSFSDPFQHVEIGGNIRGGSLADPVALDRYLSKQSKIHFDAVPEGARFEVDLHTKIEGRVATGQISARAHGMGIRGEKVRVLGDLDAVADVKEWRIDESKLRVSRSTITANEVVAHIGVSSGPDVGMRHLELTSKIDELDFGHPSLRGVDYHLVVDDASMDDARQLNALFASPPPAPPPALTVESGSAHADLEVTVLASQRTASGAVRIEIEGGGVRYHETHLAGDATLVGIVKGFDTDRDLFDFSGSTVMLRNVRATGAKAEATAWNSDVALVSASFRVSEEPTFDGFVQLHADDANPILALALRNTLPKFLVGLMRAPDLSGQARIVLEPGRVAVLDAHVRGGDVEARGDLVLRRDHELGVFIVAKGPLSAGVRLDDRGTRVRLFGLAGWRREQKREALALFAQPDAKAKADAEASAKADADAKANANANADANADAGAGAAKAKKGKASSGR